jgi:NAD+ diphosphatase
MNVRHFYASEKLDRVTHLRGNAEWLRARLADPGSRVLPVWRERLLVDLGDEGEATPRPVFLSVTVADDLVKGFRVEGLREAAILLGVLDDRAYFAVDLSSVDNAEANPLLAGRGQFVSLRRLGPFIDRVSGGLLAYAQAMVYWQGQHRYCGACGSPTRSEEAGHWLRCTAESCGVLHFPRSDPAIIVRVTHEDRCLLGRQSRWPARRYSVLAGFVEPGESLEDAVVREVFEEAGVRVEDVRYDSSQPWPFPASLMLGFTAHALDEAIRVDGDELDDVRWFTRQQLDTDVATGEVILPPDISLARHLINGWYRSAAEPEKKEKESE